MAGSLPSGASGQSFESVYFYIQAFDQLVRDHGVELVHYRTFPCPVGRIDKDDMSRRPHEDHEGCSGGMILKRTGLIKAVFSNNSTRYDFTDPGVYEASSVMITTPRFYQDLPDTIVRVLPLDRLYLDDSEITVTHWQLNEYRQDWSVDPLKFPAEHVEFLVDSNGIDYCEGVDFNISCGGIAWISGQRNPGVDLKTGRGRVYSIRFLYRPYYIVDANNHEIRIATQPGPDGTVSVLMPQLLMIRRENIFRDEDNDPLTIKPDPKREKLPPRKPLYGPR